VEQFNQAMMDWRHGLYTFKAQMRALPAANRLYRLREPLMGRVSWQKSPRQTLPERTAYFLLMQQGDQVFLQQRPPVGLWGGLFCFPQFEDEASLRDWLAQHQISADNLSQLIAFRHTIQPFPSGYCAYVAYRVLVQFLHG
jgi:A/G-specific adenine glycosylase